MDFAVTDRLIRRQSGYHFCSSPAGHVARRAADEGLGAGRLSAITARLHHSTEKLCKMKNLEVPRVLLSLLLLELTFSLYSLWKYFLPFVGLLACRGWRTHAVEGPIVVLRRTGPATTEKQFLGTF